jgi:predicted acyltransferase
MSDAPLSPPAPAAPTASARLVSLDALRGFDLFWILGADALVRALRAMDDTAPLRFFAAQLEHKAWAGFGFYDLIFPLFVFIVGVSLVFSLARIVARQGRAAAVRRILRRAALLFLLGILYNGGLAEPWPDVRLAGVLQRIALAYAAAGLLFCFCKTRALAGIAGALLLGYWALLAWVPVRDLPLDRAALIARLPAAERDAAGQPDPASVRALFDRTTARVRGHYEPGLNLPNHVDYQWLPGARYDRYYDPEGLLSTLPAIATCLLGVFAGLLLRRTDRTDREKLTWLVAAGCTALALGSLWGLSFPVVKKLWTSSFVLVAGGWSFLLLAGFYYIVDVRRWRGWCQPFVWIGMNPITLYLLSSLVDFHGIATRLAGGSVRAWVDVNLATGAGEFLVTLAGLALVVALAGFLYRRKIFLRV